MIDETLFEAEEKMEKAVSVAKDDLAAIRTGRANPSMFNKILVDYYGAPTPVNQLASFHVADARMLTLTPYDKGAMAAIEKAIRDSDLGVNPTNDGDDHPGGRSRSSPRSAARSSSRSRTRRPRTRGSRSATSAGTPRTSWTGWPRTARPARTT